MGALLGRAVLTVLLKKAVASWTSRLGATVAVSGVAAAIDPQLLGMVPDQFKPYVIGALGVGFVLARHRQEILAMYAELKAAALAGVEPPK